LQLADCSCKEHGWNFMRNSKPSDLYFDRNFHILNHSLEEIRQDSSETGEPNSHQLLVSAPGILTVSLPVSQVDWLLKAYPIGKFPKRLITWTKENKKRAKQEALRKKRPKRAREPKETVSETAAAAEP
jgi:hypothetical protein